LTQESRKPSNLFLRFLIGIPVGAVVVAIFAFGNYTLLALVFVGSWFTLREFWRLTGVDHPGEFFILARLGELATLILLYLAWANQSGSLTIMLAIFLPVFFIAQLVAKARGAENFIREVGMVTLGVLYVGGFLSFIFRLRNLQLDLQDIGVLEFSTRFFHAPDMIHFTILPVLASWCCDTAAFFSGKYFGQMQLAPTISPKKTVAGLIGGMVGSAAGITAYAWLIGLIGEIQLYELIAFGVLAAAFSQLGDLTVSAIKREAHRKDAGSLLGAHGGMLDRIDGFLFALPATYIFLLLVLD
jgi:phosphatidate cytidylyltransferase